MAAEGAGVQEELFQAGTATLPVLLPAHSPVSPWRAVKVPVAPQAGAHRAMGLAHGLCRLLGLGEFGQGLS